MNYLKPKFTLPAGPSKSTACERCVWGRGEHAEWCQERTQEIPWTGRYGKLVIDERVPNDQVWLIPDRLKSESADGWLKRCTVITNVGDGK